MCDIFDSTVSEAVTAGIRHIGIGVYSSGKILKYLINKGYSSEVASEAVKIIIKRDYIDDYRAGNKVLRSRTGRKQESRAYLRQRLINDGISSNIVNSLISELPDDSVLCRNLLLSSFSFNDVSDDDLPVILKGAVRRGFSQELARRIVYSLINEFTE